MDYTIYLKERLKSLKLKTINEDISEKDGVIEFRSGEVDTVYGVAPDTETYEIEGNKIEWDDGAYSYRLPSTRGDVNLYLTCIVRPNGDLYLEGSPDNKKIGEVSIDYDDDTKESMIDIDIINYDEKYKDLFVSGVNNTILGSLTEYVIENNNEDKFLSFMKENKDYKFIHKIDGYIDVAFNGAYLESPTSPERILFGFESGTMRVSQSDLNLLDERNNISFLNGDGVIQLKKFISKLYLDASVYDD